jgi:hypothetical protein
MRHYTNSPFDIGLGIIRSLSLLDICTGLRARQRSLPVVLLFVIRGGGVVAVGCVAVPNDGAVV